MSNNKLFTLAISRHNQHMVNDNLSIYYIHNEQQLVIDPTNGGMGEGFRICNVPHLTNGVAYIYIYIVYGLN